MLGGTHFGKHNLMPCIFAQKEQKMEGSTEKKGGGEENTRRG
jgi:hypothetical protein